MKMMKELLMMCMLAPLCGGVEPSVAELMQGVEKGDNEALVELGLRYLGGVGVDKDEQKSVEMLRKAAEQGNVKAMRIMAMLYYRGEEVPKNRSEAQKWAEQAAALGDIEAHIVMGLIYDEARDYAKAYQHFLVAAEAGNESGINAVTSILVSGKGVEKDLPGAIRWMEKLASKGEVDAMRNLGGLYAMAEDYENAFAWAKKAADAGNANSMYGVAKFYYTGQGVKQDKAEAKRLAEKAAELGEVKGVSLAAQVYEDEQNYTKALELYKKAAEQGEVKSLVMLAQLYYNGQGVAQDKEEALRYAQQAVRMGELSGLMVIGLVEEDKGEVEKALECYRKVAEIGFTPAFMRLAQMYYNGKGVEKDLAEAKKWAEKADLAGEAAAALLLGLLYDKAGDAENAVKCYMRAAESGVPNASLRLAMAYYEGKGVARDLAAAKHWGEKAAEAGDSEAQMMMGFIAREENDHAKAVKYYLMAAESGDAEACAQVAQCYYNGEGVAKDVTQAKKWAEKSAAAGSEAGFLLLGMMAEAKKDYQNAFAYFKASAEKGNSQACAWLARLYYIGRGVKEDKEEAKKWLFKSVENGEKTGLYMAGQFAEEEDDIAQAVVFYQQSADKGFSLAYAKLAQLYRSGEGVAKDGAEAKKWALKAAQADLTEGLLFLALLAEDEKDVPTALGYYKQAAERGAAQAALRLAQLYLGSSGVEQDLPEVIKWAELAAKLGSAEGMQLAGQMAEVRREFVKAREYYQQAVELQNDALSTARLAFLYYNGQGVEQDKAAAQQWAEKAVALGSMQGYLLMGQMAEDAGDYEKAYELYKLAADADTPQAYAKLAQLSYNGQGVKQDKAEAKRLAQIGADKGDGKALWVLGKLAQSENEGEAACRLFTQSAEAGEPSACYELALIYANGLGVQANTAAAKQWAERAVNIGEMRAYEVLAPIYFKDGDIAKTLECFTKMAELGLPQGYVGLALLYYDGLGVKQDRAEAMKWLNKGVETGNEKALLTACIIYEKEGNFPQAVACCRAAAEKGESHSCIKMAQYYYAGQGVERDYDEAVKWAERAAEQGNALALVIIANIHEKKGAYDKAFEFYEKAAQQGEMGGYVGMGLLCHKGLIANKDKADGVKYVQQAAASGAGSAYLVLGVLCYENEQYEKAFDSFLRAAAQGVSEAYFMLASSCYNGKGTAKNKEEAMRWAEQAVAHGDPRGYELLGTMAFDEGSFEKAFENKMQAAKAGVKSAQYAIGKMYYKGKGVAQDMAAARKWLAQAANQGVMEAQYLLGLMLQNGEGGEADEAKGRELAEKAAAELGDKVSKILSDDEK